jgi:hypothetical protein
MNLSPLLFGDLYKMTIVGNSLDLNARYMPSIEYATNTID